jgi:hypothetical protein
MKKFNDLVFETHSLGGKKARISFDNGYGASVICNSMSYGGPEGLYELAVLNHNGHIIYDTPITNDVLGWLSPNQVSETMLKIQSLPKKENITVN